MSSFIRLAAIAGVAAVALQMAACSSTAMSPPQASMENATRLRAAGLSSAAVGAFKISPAKAGDDTTISMRGGNTMKAPGNSFAQHLGDTLKVEMQSAGLLDPASPNVITGTLTQTEVNASIGTGTAKLGARFVVTRGNAVAYDRELNVDASWESSFMAAVAIPLASNNYEGLYRKLVGKLLDDAEFRAALAKP